MWYVYILKCSDKSFHTGYTSSLKNRLEKHRKEQVRFTKNRLPVELVTFIIFSDKYKAFVFEKYLKTSSGIAFRNKRMI